LGSPLFVFSPSFFPNPRDEFLRAQSKFENKPNIPLGRNGSRMLPKILLLRRAYNAEPKQSSTESKNSASKNKLPAPASVRLVLAADMSNRH
jgi:hypothetical protein